MSFLVARWRPTQAAWCRVWRRPPLAAVAAACGGGEAAASAVAAARCKQGDNF